MSVTWTLIGHYLIGEYSATKIHFFPGDKKIVKKFPPPIFHFQGWKSFLICTFLGKKFSRLALFWQKFAIFGGKLQILGVKGIKIGILG